MHGRHHLITGMTRSGKTTFAKILLREAPRAIVLDRKDEYTDGQIFNSFEMAVDYFLQHRFDPQLKIILRGSGVEETDTVAFSGFLQLIEHSQQVDHLPPISVFLEEASLFSGSHEIDPNVRAIYLYGARYHISLVSIVQRDVLSNPIVRDSSEIIIAFRNMKTSQDMRIFFDPSELAALETLKPGMDAIAGHHFLVYPPEADILPEWKALLDDDGEWETVEETTPESDPETDLDLPPETGLD